MAAPTQQKPANYINNKTLLEQVIKAKKAGKMTDELARSLMLLTERFARRGNFVGYSYNEDMRGFAMMMLVRTWNSFDPEKSNNPFAFFTQCIKNSFIQYLNQEKKQRAVRDEILVDMGMNPSYGFGDGTSRSGERVYDEEDFESQRAVTMEIEKAIRSTETSNSDDQLPEAEDSETPEQY